MRKSIPLIFYLILIMLSVGCKAREEESMDILSIRDISFEDVLPDADVADDIEQIYSCNPTVLKNGNIYQDKFSLSLFHYNIQYIAGGGLDMRMLS